MTHSAVALCNRTDQRGRLHTCSLGRVPAAAADEPWTLDVILVASAKLAAVAASVRTFAAMMNERRGRKLLEPWMNAAIATGEPALRSFVTGLRAD
jgi:hypothetical protein